MWSSLRPPSCLFDLRSTENSVSNAPTERCDSIRRRSVTPEKQLHLIRRLPCPESTDHSVVLSLTGTPRARTRASAKALTDRAGLHRNHVGLVERGLRSPSIEVVRRLAIGLDTTMTAFPRWRPCLSSAGPEHSAARTIAGQRRTARGADGQGRSRRERRFG